MSLKLVNIKNFMILYLGALFIVGTYYIGDINYFWKGLLVALLYIILDLLWTYFRDGIWYIPSSSVISGFILALVGAPAPSLPLLILLPFIAVVSKQLITLWKPRHIFNPAAFSMAVLSLAGYSAVSWWGVAWGQEILYVVLLVGLFILWRQKRWDTALSFIISYTVFLAILFLNQGRDASQLFLILRPQLFDGTTLFFATVMLIEPITSNYPGRKNRIVYGLLVGLLAVIFTTFGQYLFQLDPLIGGLLIGNLIMGLLVIKSRSNQLSN
jgi:glycine betaine catabolism B